jgi:hypothetical protein
VPREVRGRGRMGAGAIHPNGLTAHFGLSRHRLRFKRVSIPFRQGGAFPVTHDV